MHFSCDGKQIGQNVYATTGGFKAKDAVNLWNSERKYWDFSRNTCNAPTGKSCGHWTQVYRLSRCMAQASSYVQTIIINNYINWRSVKGFLVGGVPKFALSHWLCWSSLQQRYATACTVIIIIITSTRQSWIPITQIPRALMFHVFHFSQFQRPILTACDEAVVSWRTMSFIISRCCLSRQFALNRDHTQIRKCLHQDLAGKSGTLSTSLIQSLGTSPADVINNVTSSNNLMVTPNPSIISQRLENIYRVGQKNGATLLYSF